MSLRQSLRILRDAKGYDIGKPPSLLERWKRSMEAISDAPTFLSVVRGDATDREAGIRLKDDHE